MAAPLLFELVQWRDPGAEKPDADITVAGWTAEDGLLAVYWDDGLRHWIDCTTGGELGSTLLAWADPQGPVGLPQVPPSEVPVHQVRAALSEALDLLRGWVDHKCPKKHQAEHLGVIKVLAEAGGLSS